MTWVRIDKQSTEIAMNRTIDASKRAIVLLDTYRVVDTMGLGDLGPSTADLIGSTWRALSDAWETYLRESIAVLEKLLALIADQQAASVVGFVNAAGLAPAGVALGAMPSFGTLSPAEAIIGGTVVGGSVTGSATYTGSGFSIIGGTFLGETTPMGGGYAIVGGTPSYANDPLMRAAMAAQERGDTRLASQMLGVSAGINDSINHSIALTLAPNGARSMGAYGPSSGYEAYGSYGIEVPIYSR